MCDDYGFLPSKRPGVGIPRNRASASRVADAMSFLAAGLHPCTDFDCLKVIAFAQNLCFPSE